MTAMDTKATIDQLEDSEYISDVNKRLEIRYNNPPQINLTPWKEVDLKNNVTLSVQALFIE